jgi:protein-tyrosine phosphatase
MYQITDTLFVGNIYEAEKPPARISAVLLVAEEFTPPPPPGVIYERIPFKEFGEANPASLHLAIEWIARHHADNRVLVCCRAGMGRSVSVVMAYLCCVHQMAYPDVYQLIMNCRPGACPLPNIQSTIKQVLQLRQGPRT